MSARARAAGLQDATLVETVREFGWPDRLLLAMYLVTIIVALAIGNYTWALLFAVLTVMWLHAAAAQLTKTRLRRTLASLRGDL